MSICQIPAKQTTIRKEALQGACLMLSPFIQADQAQVETVGNIDIADTDILITDDDDMVSDQGTSDSKKRYFTSVQPTFCLA
jgi:hypothetical protein